jgi:hypothetical protein
MQGWYRTSRALRNDKVLAGVNDEALYVTREAIVSGHKYKIGQLVNYLGRDRASGVSGR